MAQPNSNTILYDSTYLLHDGSAITSTTVTSVAYVDVGNARVVGSLVIPISAIDVASTNETYRFSLQGSANTSFNSAGLVIPLFEWACGDGPTQTTAGSDTGIDTQTGTYRFPFTNELLGLHFRYLRLKVICGGTTPSITCAPYLALDVK